MTSSNAPIRRVESAGEMAPAAIESTLTPREWSELVDLIVQRIEDRVVDELARRGRRFNPGVF